MGKELVSQHFRNGLQRTGIKDEKNEWISYLDTVTYLDYNNKGLILLDELTTKDLEENKGYATKILNRISEKILEDGSVGILKNGIPLKDKKRKIYEHRGWKFFNKKFHDWMYLSGRKLDLTERSKLEATVLAVFEEDYYVSTFHTF